MSEQQAVPKIEGHAAFYAHLKNGHVDKAKVIGLENDRFIEKILVGRKYWEAPIITSRICGICPTIHNVTSTRAIESACDIQPSEQTKKLRELMLYGQMIQSHSLHLYLLVLPDFVGASSSFELQKSHPEIFKNAIELKRYADKIIEVVGGRAVHPVASVPGGFKSYPKQQELKELAKSADMITTIAENTFRLFANIEYPAIERELIYSALHKNTGYTIYDGDIHTTDKQTFKSSNYTQYLSEELKPYTRAKFATLKNKIMNVGAVARLNLNGIDSLDEETVALAKEFKLKTPFNNPFGNTIAQALENHHFVIKAIKSINHFIKNGIEEEPLRQPKHFGIGTAACEAPRGTLFHHYELDKDGFITKCDLITPTVQSLTALEQDILLFDPLLQGLKPEERNQMIEKLIRAYDPCITCATH